MLVFAFVHTFDTTPSTTSTDKSGPDVAVRRHDRALKIAPATPFFRVRNRLGDFPIFDPDFKTIDLKSNQDPTRDLIQSDKNCL